MCVSFSFFTDFVFFFNQKTSYVFRISDWTSDVCSSDCITNPRPHRPQQKEGVIGIFLIGLSRLDLDDGAILIGIKGKIEPLTLESHSEIHQPLRLTIGDDKLHDVAKAMD